MGEKKDKYPTERMKSWEEVKQIRKDYYINYARAHEKGGLRWAGGAWSFDAIPAGLGDDVFMITSEPYGASCAFNKDISIKYLEATEKAGYARDLCAYMRNYWGSLLLDDYVFSHTWPELKDVKGFPKPDFLWQDHICCSHAKWYQVVSEIEGGIPHFSIDVASGPEAEINERRIEYLVGQMHDGIEWLEETTGRKYNDNLLIKAVLNECRSTSTWAEICCLNKTIPAPLDEKTMYSYYVLGTLNKASQRVADFYEQVLDEVKDRVERGIAACPNEQCRVMTDTQPPWGFLKVFRYLEKKFGTVSIGSLYTFALIGAWEYKEDGSWGPKTTPQQQKMTVNDRDTALRVLAEWNLHKPEWQHFYSPHLKTEMMHSIAKEWKLNGIMLHYNRGCEGLSVGIAENRLGLQEKGWPVFIFEGNMGDEREFDESRTTARMDAFMESLGVKSIQ
jgi:benzoyl-CoA reductase subunit B